MPSEQDAFHIAYTMDRDTQCSEKLHDRREDGRSVQIERLLTSDY